MTDLKVENAKKAARRRFEARELLARLKKKPCTDCGEKFHPCQMDFLRGDGKPGKPISKMLLKSKTTIIKEVEKCVLVCANCARLRNFHKQRAERSGAT